MNLDPAEGRIFFRSQASATALGGLAPTTFQVARVLSLIFDVPIVETVGIGQSEADIRHLADRVYLVMARLGGRRVPVSEGGDHRDPRRLRRQQVGRAGGAADLPPAQG